MLQSTNRARGPASAHLTSAAAAPVVRESPIPPRHRHVVLEKGQVAWTGSSAELAADPSLRQRFLQV